MADLPMLPQGIGILKDSCQTFIYVVKRYGLRSRKKSNGRFPKTKKAMTTAIEPMIGPTEFSAKAEKRKAKEATTVMDQTAEAKARSIRRGIWASGIRTNPNFP